MKLASMVLLSLLVLSYAPQMSMDRMWSELDELMQKDEDRKNAIAAKSFALGQKLSPYSYFGKYRPVRKIRKFTPYEITAEDRELIKFCYYSFIQFHSESCDWLVTDATKEGTLANRRRYAALRNEFARYAFVEYEYMVMLEMCYDRQWFGFSQKCNEMDRMMARGNGVVPNQAPNKLERAMYKYFVAYAKSRREDQ